MEYLQKFNIQGVANTVTYDAGLESSKENPKRILSVFVQVDEVKGNDVQGWWEREKILEIGDDLIDTMELNAATISSKSFNRLNEIAVGYDIPIGSTFMMAISCGANANVLRGAYRYEISGS